MRAGQLPGPHRDPFDRMLIAQAAIENLRIITNDPVFRDYGTQVIWQLTPPAASPGGTRNSTVCRLDFRSAVG